MGILEILVADKVRRNRIADAKQAYSGLLGGTVTSEMSGTSAEFDEFGNPIEIRQQPSSVYDRQGSGFLGSNRGIDAQRQLRSGMVGAGYQPQEIASILGQQVKPQGPTSLMRNMVAAGVDLDSSEGQKQMLEILKKPQTSINMGTGAGTLWTDEQKKSAGLSQQAVVTTDRYGKPQILNKEKWTQPQILSGTYAARMDDATNSINKIMETGFDPAGIMQNIDFFGSPEIIANYARTPEGQQYRQAQENWISANLRKESGAAIPEEEMDREIKKWFPYPGDKASNIAQKSQSRKTAERGMRKAGGGAYHELIEQAERDRLSELRSKHGTN